MRKKFNEMIGVIIGEVLVAVTVTLIVVQIDRFEMGNKYNQGKY